MSVMESVRTLDPQPVLTLIQAQGGQCSFDEAADVLVKQGMTLSYTV
jgi:hypothetical protein